MSKQFAIIGMGRIGSSLAKTLDSLGHEVLGIDSDQELIEELSAEMPQVNLVTADATESTVLRDLGLEQFDGAAVMIGDELGTSVLATFILKDLEVPLVFARAIDPHHARILERIGADYVVRPEQEFGELLARQMSYPGLKDYVEFGPDEAVIEMETPQEWVGKSLGDLHLYRKEGLTVLAIKGEGKEGSLPRPEAPLKEGDILVIGGPKERLDGLDPSAVV